MKKVYYLTRSYWPQKTGGTLIRREAVRLLEQNGFDVTVFTPNYGSKDIVTKGNVIYFPNPYNISISMYYQRFGIYEDYLDKWCKDAVNYLKNIVKKDEIIFATSGGELGNIKLGSLLKSEVGCKFVVNFHDPIEYSIVDGMREDSRFHVSREKQEQKYLQNADLIITSSKKYKEALKNKYTFLGNKIRCNYFGYIKNEEIELKKKRLNLRIAYAGIFSDIQSPQVLIESTKGIKDVELFFIGNHSRYLGIQKYYNKYNFIDLLPHENFLKFMLREIDVGFVSLKHDFYGFCVPSKIYEYINLGLPILGALPDGDAMNIINNNGYGIALKYNDYEGIRKSVEKLKNSEILNEYRENILKDKYKWSMEYLIKEMVEWLHNL